MARLVAVQQQTQPSLSLLPSSLSDFSGTRLHSQVQCTSFPYFIAMHFGKMFSSLLLIPIYLFDMFLGREAVEVEPILDALPKLEQFIYCSSAGVYLKSDLLPHSESLSSSSSSSSSSSRLLCEFVDSQGFC
ncbi:hypothetical protein OIU84_018171 [Salix udensis]|uniref:Uncharacterized protein n=1 Tax=Salix udensis TaxID=889485 RepID=A0AAD6PML5_9ROSI|nr:hypothetical protein OIU84_018171 [Salix udensis]